MDLTYPSNSFPPPPSMRLSAPDDWQPVAVPDAVIAVLAGKTDGDFVANIVVVVSRIVGHTTLAELVATLHQRTLDDFPGAQLAGSATTTIAGYEGAARAYLLEGGAIPRPLFQATIVLVAPTANPEVSHAIQLTGTCAAEASEQYAALFRDAMHSLALA